MIFIAVLFGLQTQSLAAPENSTLSSLSLCANNAHIANNSFCRMTPEKYQTTVYEMGLCSSHPFNNGATGTATLDKSTCTTIFSNTAGHTVDIISVIGGTGSLVGTSTRPAEGTYKYPYMIMSNTFTVRGSTKGVAGGGNAGNTYYSTTSGTPDQTAPADDYAFDLENLGNGAISCYSGMVDQISTAGTIDAFLTDNAFVRPDRTAKTGVNCNGISRLIGVMDLTTPFTVTSNTISVKFTFNVTGFGLRSWANNAGAVTKIEGGPFGGNFSVINTD
jgi:hypothetical protein